MSEFVVETYAARETRSIVAARVERVALAADRASLDRARVRLVHAIFMPDDETCLYLYESESADAVGAAVVRAGLGVERITEAVSIRAPE